MRVRGNDVVFRDRVRRDFRLAVHNRHVVVVQALEGSFCCIREGQLVVIAYGCRPLAIRAVQCSFIVIADRAKILEQRFFRIAVDQVLARLGAVRVVVLRRIERRTIDRLCIADIDRQISLRDTGRVVKDLRRLTAFELVVAVRQRRLDIIRITDMLRLDRIAVCIVDIRRRRGRVADLFIAVDALDLDFDWSRRVTIDRREMRVRGNDVIFRDRVRRDFRLAVYNRHVIVMQAFKCIFRFLREAQIVLVAYWCCPLAICAVKCSFIVIDNRAEILEQRFFRIAVDQALTFIGAVHIIILRLIELRAIDCLSIADVNDQSSRINIDVAPIFIFIPYSLYVVIFRVNIRSRNRVRSNIIRITMTFIIRRNGTICI